MVLGPQICPQCQGRFGKESTFCPVDGSPLSEVSGTDPRIGLVLDGQFRIEEKVGEGAMASVYRAHQASLERFVAVKILHAQHVNDELIQARFAREGRASAYLAHPNLVSLLSHGCLPTRAEPDDSADPPAGSSGEAYLVMEFLDGQHLGQILEQAGGKLDIATALHIVLQICDAMGEAHGQGVVHRDIKPENVMLVRQGADESFVKVLDFGVAAVGHDDQLATLAGSLFGSALYMSPEGSRGETVEAPGDVYSIACLLYRCLSGQPPFEGGNAIGVLIQHRLHPPRPLAERAPSVPVAISDLVQANLSKSPADRETDARAFGRRLAHAAVSAGSLETHLGLGATLMGPR
ncbi:MAG: serine/threonine protein kinase [Polyangiaceae bacterium]|nr:serine/threonine protein kinase [Polyangiaceae bacterium]